MKRFLFIALLACLALVAGAWWHQRQRLFAARRAAVAQADAVTAALAERIDTADFAGEDRRWGDVFSALAARCAVPLVVNDAEARSMGVDRQTRVDVPAGIFPLGELLDDITGGMDLGWRRSGGSIEITSVSEAESGRLRLFTRVYPLPAANAAGEKVIDDAEELAELIVTHVVPESWEEVGGQGVLVTAGSAVVVRQTDAIHGLIREFLSQMESSGGWLGQLAEDTAGAEEDQRIARALAEIDSVDFHELPLAEALRSLTAQHGLRFQFSEEALANGAADLTIPMTLSLSNVSLRTILRELLAQQQLTYVIRPGSLVVTTVDAAESHLIHGVYDVRDLVETGGQRDFDSLIQFVMTTVELDSWDDVGGPGTIGEMGDRWLIVSQTQEIQEKVEHTLARVRAILTPGVDPAGDGLEPVDDVAQTVARALDREVTIRCENEPLSALCADLSRQLGIPILVKRATLDEIAVALDTPVTVDLPPLPLRDALALALDNLQLAFDPRGEVLYITTPEDADENLVTRIIDVRHLLDPTSGRMDEDTLIELVTTCVAPDMWEEVGGPGSQFVFRGLLVFRQTHEVSRQVQELIDAISEHCLPSRAGTAADDQREPVWVGMSPARQEILRKLQSPVSVTTKDVKVTEVIREVCRQCSVPVFFVRHWYYDATTYEATFRVNLSLDQVSGWEALTRVEARQAAGFLVERGVLVVTQPDYAASETVLSLYLLSLPEVEGGPQHADHVADMLAERLEPDTWSVNGGYGVVLPVNDEWLLVAQTLPMHRRVEEALAKLRAGQMLPLPSVGVISGLWKRLDKLRLLTSPETWQRHLKFLKGVEKSLGQIAND